jgi:hypothetical protein
MRQQNGQGETEPRAPLSRDATNSQSMRIALAWVGCSLIFAGCQHFERAHQCRAFADGVNPELKELSASYSKRSPASAGEYHEARKKYAAAAARLEKSKFKEPELAHLAEEIRDNLLATGRSCDRLAAKFEHPERPVDQLPPRELEAQRQRHLSLVSAVDKFCQLQ